MIVRLLLKSLIYFGVFVAVVVMLFLILRQVVTWYWKINDAIALLAKIEENTRQKAPEQRFTDTRENTCEKVSEQSFVDEGTLKS